MKTISFFTHIVLLGTILLFSAHAVAQPRSERPQERERMMPPGGPAPEEFVMLLKDKLDLTDAQIEKIKAVFKEQGKKMRQQRYESEERRAEEHEKMMDQQEKMRKETDEKISSVLSAEQQKKFQALQKELQQRHERRGPDEGPDGHPAPGRDRSPQ